MSKSNPIFCIDEIGLRRVLRETVLRNLIVKDPEFEDAFIEGLKKEEASCQRLGLPPWDLESAHLVSSCSGLMSDSDSILTS